MVNPETEVGYQIVHDLAQILDASVASWLRVRDSADENVENIPTEKIDDAIISLRREKNAVNEVLDGMERLRLQNESRKPVRSRGSLSLNPETAASS